MSRTSALITLGVLTILTPFSGLPSGYRTAFTVLFGAVVACIGLAARAEEAKGSQVAETPSAAMPEPAAPHEMSAI